MTIDIFQISNNRLEIRRWDLGGLKKLALLARETGWTHNKEIIMLPENL